MVHKKSTDLLLYELDSVQSNTANILPVKNTAFRCVFSHALPVPFWHLTTVPSTADIRYFQLYFWKKKSYHIIQAVVHTLKPV